MLTPATGNRRLQVVALKTKEFKRNKYKRTKAEPRDLSFGIT